MKDVFVKAQHFCYNNGKGLFSNMVKVTVERSCLKSLVSHSHSLALCNFIFYFFLFQWLQLFIYFFICSYAPLCPTWLSGYRPIEPKKRRFCLFLPDWKEAHPRTSRELKRALSSSHLQGLHCFLAFPPLSAAASSTLKTCDLHGEWGWADGKSLNHVWYCREKTVGQAGRRERWLIGMRISAKVAFDIEVSNNVEKKEAWVHVRAL